MQIWIHDNKMKKITALNNDVPDMLSYTNSTWHSYLDQATSTFDFTIPKFSNGELHEDLKLINDECFVSFYVNGSYQVFYIATLQEDDFNIQLTCNNTNLEYALEYANPFNSSSAQSIQWYLEHMDLLSFAAVEIGNNEISDRKRTLTFDSQETKMNRLQSLMSKFEAEFEFKVELNRDGTYKRIVINIYQEADDTHHGIGTDRKDVVLYYSNGLKGVQVTSDKTQMFNAAVFTGKDGLSLNDVEISEKNADGIEEFYSRKGNPCLYAPIAMNRYPATMRAEGQDNWIRKDFTTEYENVNDLKAYALRTLKQYAYPLVTYTASVQSGFVSQYTDLKLGDTIRIIDKNFVGGLALEARVSEMIISFDNPANNSFVFTNYRKLDNKPSSALQTRIEQVIESRLSYRIELATTGGVTFKNNEGETIIKPSLYKGNLPWTKDVTWHWTLNGVVTDGMQYHIQARDITDTAVLTVDAFVGGKKVATTEVTLTNVNDGPQGPQGPQGDEGPQGPQGDEGPQGPQGDTGNGIANTVITYGLSMSDTTEPATWSSDRPALVKGMYLWTRTVIIYTNGESTTSYQISYIAKDADATAAIDKTKQELLEKLDTVRNDSLAAVEEAKQELTTVADDLSQAKQDLTSQAQQLQAQANAQSELTNRVSSVEQTANGTKTTVSELSKTVAQNGKDITSVTARTKVVEDDLTSTKTTLSQVKTTADSTSQKTATLESGLDGLTAKFNSLSVGAVNLFKGSRDFSGSWLNADSSVYAEDYKGVKIFKKQTMWGGVSQYFEAKTGEEYVFSAYIKSSAETDRVGFYLVHSNKQPQAVGRVTFESFNNQDFVEFNISNEYKRIAIKIKITNGGWMMPRLERSNTNAYLFFGGYKLEHGNVATDYSPSEVDFEQKVAEYKQTADQNYASLQSNLQTLDGTVKQNKSEFDQTASQIKSSISAVEGKIPTSSGGRNLALGTSSEWSTPYTNFKGTSNTTLNLYKVLVDGLSVGDTLKSRIVLKCTNIVPTSEKTANIWLQGYGNVTDWGAGSYNTSTSKTISGSGEVVFEHEFKITADHLKNDYWSWQLRTDYIASGSLQWKLAKVEAGDLSTPWSPAPEDTASQIRSLSSQIQQTADGMTLLATKTELNTAKNELQSGINTATNKANSNAQTISTHTTQISALNIGLQAKVSQTDFNTLSGRVTTAENNIIAKANELSSKITSVEGKIPTSIGGRNLYALSKNSPLSSNDIGDLKQDLKTGEISFKVTSRDPYFGAQAVKNEAVGTIDRGVKIPVKTGQGIAVNLTNELFAKNFVSYFGDDDRAVKNYKDYQTNKFVIPANELAGVSYVTFRFGIKEETQAVGSTHSTKIKVEYGNVYTDWSPAPEDTAEQISSLSSEFKQTTDTIKASVSSLDKSTVKSSSLTINSDGIVMKAGKTTTDVANAIGSYFSVNQNAINLFSDKINVKGSMIVDGAITSNKIAAGAITADKIAANSISSSKIVSSGITANVIKGGVLQSLNGSTNFELDTGKLFYNNNNTGVFRVQDGASTMGLKFSNTSLTVNGTSRILSRAILGGDRRESTLDDGKWDKGGFSGLVIETIKGVEPTDNEHADAMRVIADNIYFTHTYNNDSLSARGWKMETYSPKTSYPDNVVLKPYGINYRNSDIIVGDLRLDNGDGSGYWMRATINVLKACFGHILNGGISSSALNAIRSELDKISGT